SGNYRGGRREFRVCRAVLAGRRLRHLGPDLGDLPGGGGVAGGGPGRLRVPASAGCRRGATGGCVAGGGNDGPGPGPGVAVGRAPSVSGHARAEVGGGRRVLPRGRVRAARALRAVGPLAGAHLGGDLRVRGAVVAVVVVVVRADVARLLRPLLLDLERLQHRRL